MAPATATVLSDNEKLLIAALSQFAAGDSKFPSLNTKKLAEDLGLATANAASIRVCKRHSSISHFYNRQITYFSVYQWCRLTAKIKEGKFGDLKIAGAGSPTKRTKDEAGIEDNGEGMAGTPTKKQKAGGTRKKAGGANGKVKKEVSTEEENPLMSAEDDSPFNIFDDLNEVQEQCMISKDGVYWSFEVITGLSRNCVGSSRNGS